MAKKNTRAFRQKDKLRKQRQRQTLTQAFVFNPVTNAGRYELKRRLKIPFSLHKLPDAESVNVPLTRVSACRKIIGDGNCLFRAISHALFGNEIHHMHVRHLICSFMLENPEDIARYLPVTFDRNVDEYMRRTNMQHAGTWGTDIEMIVASIIFQVNIFVYSKTGVHWTWIKNSPENLDTQFGIYLYHKDGNHFDVVIATDTTEVPSDYPGTVYDLHECIRQYKAQKRQRDNRNYMNKRYKFDHEFKTSHKKKQIEKYAKDKSWKTNFLEKKRSKYSTDSAHRSKTLLLKTKAYSKQKKRKLYFARAKYNSSSYIRRKIKLLSKRKYAYDKEFKNRIKRYSKTKYATNSEFRDKVKAFSKAKYATNTEFRDNVKYFSKDKYATNEEFRENVKDFSKDKYANNAEFRENIKDFSKDKYANNAEFRENVKDFSKDKYANNAKFRENVKDFSKEKYATNADFRKKVKAFSRYKYTTFCSFRNNVKASSIKKYANHPLFRHKLKQYLRQSYKTSSSIRQAKKNRVAKSRQSVKYNINNFRKAAYDTPHYVCCVCVRLLFKKQVKKCKKEQYVKKNTKTMNEAAERCFSAIESHQCDNECSESCWKQLLSKDNTWICHTCDRHLKQGSTPPQAMTNNLFLSPVPEVLAKLNTLERQLVSLRIPFLKLLSLPRGGQKGVKGPVVNVPSHIPSVTTSLPRSLKESQLIKVKLKRKLSYKGHYTYEWINPLHVFGALRMLKTINKWYQNIHVDNSRLDVMSDEELVLQDGDNTGNDSAEESDNEETEMRFPVESCFQPTDIGQDFLDSNSTLCVAPAEGQKPENIFQEPGSDAMAFPTLLPDGKFGLFEDREIKLSPAKYFNARLFSADSRFAKDKQFVFFAQYVTELNYISSNISLALRKGQHSTNDGQTVTASMLLDADHVADILKSDIGYRFLQPVRGTPPYWQKTLKDLYAMIRQIGIPTWFLTLSAAETRWNEVVETLMFVNNDNRSIEDLDWNERCSLVTDNPVMCARMFDHRVKSFFTNLIMTPSSPIGTVIDYFYRTEFQQRGSPHVHCLFWIKDAPFLNINEDEDVCSFIDKYISCCMPDETADPELHNIISAVQVHSKSHSKSCRKYNTTCRFNFPRPPINKTFIAKSVEKENTAPTKEMSVEELDKLSKFEGKNPRHLLRDIWTLVSAAEETKQTFPEILQLVGITYEEFEQCLTNITKTNTVYLQRTINDIWVNNYNSHLSRTWNANLDIQFVTDAYACIAYILSYISKAETEMSDLLETAKQEANEGNTDAASAMKKIGHVYLHNREVSAQEAAYRVTGMHLKECTREVVFVPCGSNILKMSLPISVIRSRSHQGGGDDENIWMTSIHDKYYARPKHSIFNDMCLAEFCSTFRFIPKSQNPKSTDLLPVYQLLNDLGKVKKRKAGKEAIVRYPRFNTEKSPEEYHLSLVQLFLHHRTPITLDEEFGSYTAYVNNAVLDDQLVKDIIDRNKARFEHNTKELDQAWEDLQDGRVNDAGWGALAAEAEAERIEIEMEHQPEPGNPENEQDEIPELTFNKQAESVFTYHYEPPEIPDDVIRDKLRNMNELQRKVFFWVKQWCLKVLWKERPEPFFMFLTGGAGTGKSHVIKCIYHESVKILSKCTESPDSIVVLLTAPTGTAAFNIQGMTIHSAFAINKKVNLPYQPLGENLLNTLRSKFSDLKILIIDEISMVDQKILTYIDGRLRQIKHNKQPFGNVSVVAVGDFYQLPPVRGFALYKRRDGDFADLWNSMFLKVTLTEVMRQKDDLAFSQMLNRIRVHNKGDDLSDSDKTALKTISVLRIPDDEQNILHIFPTNREVDHHNSIMVEKCCNPINLSVAKDFYIDTVSGKLRKKDEPYSTCAAEDLQTVIKVGIGARVMLTRNLDIDDGLVNGAFGSVTATELDNTKNVKAVYVKFDNSKIGQKLLKKQVVIAELKDFVRITPFQDNLTGKKVTRKQLPLKLAWAATIHKVQGMTIDKIAVSLKNVFQAGMSYVALSRCTSLSGLRLLDAKEEAIYCSSDITDFLNEMPLFFPVQDQNYSELMSLKIIFHNTEGLLSHLLDIKSMREFQDADVVCFTETWINNQNTMPITCMPSYDVFNLTRSAAYTSRCEVTQKLAAMNRGGVCVFVKRSLKSGALPLNTTDLEAIAVAVKDTLIVTVYRPPSYPLQIFMENFKTLLAEIQTTQLPSIIVGDFNVNILSDTSTPFIKTLQEFGYCQMVDNPTTEAGTCLDLVFLHRTLDNVRITDVPTHYSFHNALKIEVLHDDTN